MFLFNKSICKLGLVEIPLQGRKFTSRGWTVTGRCHQLSAKAWPYRHLNMSRHAEGHGGPLGPCQPIAALHLPACHTATPRAERGGSAISRAGYCPPLLRKLPVPRAIASPRGSREGERPSGHAGTLLVGAGRCGRDRGRREKEMQTDGRWPEACLGLGAGCEESLYIYTLIYIGSWV